VSQIKTIFKASRYDARHSSERGVIDFHIDVWADDDGEERISAHGFDLRDGRDIATGHFFVGHSFDTLAEAKRACSVKLQEIEERRP